MSDTKMTRLEALKSLADKVEAGDGRFSSVLPSNLQEHWPNFYRSFDGSLDSARALHGALLPDWGWRVQDMGLPAAVLAKGDYVIECRGPNPARAWLLAVIKALIAEEEK